MFQNFLMRKMLKSQGVPDAQAEIFIKMMEKNPDLFKAIAEEVQAKTKSGMTQMNATMLVMKKYEAELKKLV